MISLIGSVIGTVSTYATQTVTFEVDVIDTCINTVITTTIIATPQTYDIWSGTTLILAHADWT